MNIIEIDRLVKGFNGNPVLKGISLGVGKGEVFGFLGPNGAGKTTTMRIILGLLRPTSGQALAFNRDLGENMELRKRVGVLLEDDGLYPRLSAQDNLAYFARLYGVDNIETRVKETLELVGLAGRGADKLGYYSKGMKRRLGLARSILHRPELLMMDEPSSGLDPEAQKLVRDLIIELSGQEGVTIFLNSHDLDEVQRICSRVAILQHGEIKALDTIKNLTEAKTPRISVTFRDAREAEEGMEIARSLACITRAVNSGNTLELALNAGVDTSVLLGEFLGKGLRVEEVKKLTKSLEDIYLEAVREEDTP